MVNISCTQFKASMVKDRSGIMDLRFGIQLAVQCSVCLLFYSENVIEPTLSLSMRKKGQHLRYIFPIFLKIYHKMQFNSLPFF